MGGAGLVIVLLAVLAGVVAVNTERDQPTANAPVSTVAPEQGTDPPPFPPGSAPEEASVFDLAVGDCFDFPSGHERGDPVSDLSGRLCDEPHVGETYAAVQLPAGVYPGETAVSALAEEACATGFEEYVGVPLDARGDIRANWFSPTRQGWENQDDREVLCWLEQADGEPLSRSQRDSGTGGGNRPPTDEVAPAVMVPPGGRSALSAGGVALR